MRQQHPRPALRSPRSLRPALAAGAALALALASGCGGHDDHGGEDAGSVNCALETTADDFVIGLSRAGDAGRLGFEITSVSPAPPARGDNEWIVQVTAAGAPVSDATIFVTPFMPKHDHGTPIDVEVEPQATAGAYKLFPVNLWMPGLWETTLEVTSASGDDTVVFRVCIPG